MKATRGFAAGEWRSTIDTGVTLVVVLAAVLVVWRNMGPRALEETAEPAPAELVNLGPATKGSLEARAAMIVFSDFECSYCQQLGGCPDSC